MTVFAVDGKYSCKEFFKVIRFNGADAISDRIIAALRYVLPVIAKSFKLAGL